MLPQYNTILFSNVFEDVEAFLESYQSNGLPTKISDSSASTLFYLLYAKYGNNPIANYDINQFKYKLFAIVFQYGPTWEKRLEIQDKLRALTDNEIVLGSKAIYNHAYNPSTDPSTQTLEELQAINEQNTTNYKKSKLEAYATVMELLKTDVTESFLREFKKLFKPFVSPERERIYVTNYDEEI